MFKLLFIFICLNYGYANKDYILFEQDILINKDALLNLIQNVSNTDYPKYVQESLNNFKQNYSLRSKRESYFINYNENQYTNVAKNKPNVDSEILTKFESIWNKTDQDSNRFYILNTLKPTAVMSKVSLVRHQKVIKREIKNITIDEYISSDEIDELTDNLTNQSKKITDKLPGIKNPVLIESDILLSGESINDFILKQKSSSSATLDKNALWPNGVVNYMFSQGHFTQSETNLIRTAMKTLEESTCIKFKHSTNNNYLKFIKGSGCYSLIGRNPSGRDQPISIGFGCLYKGTIMHEIIHALGFYHEQSRLDRDDYVNIYWTNIIPGLEYNFIKYNSINLTPYDYKSLMHYDNLAFSVDGKRETIVSKDNTKLIHSAFKDMPSKYDIEKINKLYNCDAGELEPEPTTQSNTCKDKHESCNDWFNSIQCNSLFLEIACAKSCSISLNKDCDNDKLECKDFSNLCSYWSNLNQCSTDYVKYVCQKSCGCII